MSNILEFKKKEAKEVTVMQEYNIGNLGLLTNIRTQISILRYTALDLINQSGEEDIFVHMGVVHLLTVVDDLYRDIFTPFHLTTSIGVRFLNNNTKNLSVLLTGVDLDRFPKVDESLTFNYRLEVQFYELGEEEMPEGGYSEHSTFSNLKHYPKSEFRSEALQLIYNRIVSLIDTNGGLGAVIDGGDRLLVLLPYSGTHAIAISLEGDLKEEVIAQ